MPVKTCPIEDVEEELFNHWCEEQGFTHFHVPQETYTNSWKQKAHNKALGVLEGVSDHFVVIPTPLHPNGSLVVIEFKRKFGNTPSDAQIDFLTKLYAVDNIGPVCCYGCDEAIEVVEGLMKGDFGPFDKCWERTNKLIEKRKKRAKKPEKARKSAEIEENPKNDLPY